LDYTKNEQINDLLKPLKQISCTYNIWHRSFNKRDLSILVGNSSTVKQIVELYEQKY